MQPSYPRALIINTFNCVSKILFTDYLDLSYNVNTYINIRKIINITYNIFISHFQFGLTNSSK